MATLYAVIYASGLADPTVAQVKAGQQTGGSAATWSGSTTAPTSSGTFTWPTAASGLTANTSYKVAFVWSDGTNDTAVSVSTAFTTLTLVSGSLAATETGTDTFAADDGSRPQVAGGGGGKDRGPRYSVRVNGKLHVGTRAQVLQIIEQMAQADARAAAAQPQAPKRETAIRKQAERVATRAIESVRVEQPVKAQAAAVAAPKVAPRRDELVAEYVRAYAAHMLQTQRAATEAMQRAIADAMRREAEIEADDMDAIERVLQMI